MPRSSSRNCRDFHSYDALVIDAVNDSVKSTHPHEWRNTRIVTNHCHILEFNGDSYHFKVSFRAKQVAAPSRDGCLFAYHSGCFRFYNNERPHQGLGYRTPAEVYKSNAPKSDTIIRTAALHRNPAPVLSGIVLSCPDYGVHLSALLVVGGSWLREVCQRANQSNSERLNQTRKLPKLVICPNWKTTVACFGPNWPPSRRKLATLSEQTRPASRRRLATPMMA